MRMYSLFIYPYFITFVIKQKFKFGKMIHPTNNCLLRFFFTVGTPENFI